MNKNFIVTFAVLMAMSSFGIHAQENSEAFDIKSFFHKRKMFFTSELNLTPREVEEFIPILEELQQKKFEAGQRCRKLTREIKHKTNPKDSEYLEIIDECLKVGLKEAELEKEYYEIFKKVLSPEKLYRYKEVEFKFVREFLDKGSNARDRGGHKRGEK
ncbi:MAG: hypothetical protein LBH04_00640 [Tannerellaceae bacterium]|jgi:hypothetical protein|nr:hypothetical protein [Tannerellaceae bacterium]